MKVSIITPAYNCEAFLEKCILSVKNQDYPDIDHVIVNDGSTDNTEHIAKKYQDSYQLKLISQQNHGIAYTMNKGFETASGDIFAWLDADNFYADGIIGEVAKVFENNPHVDVVYGNIDFVDIKGNKTGSHKPPRNISFKKALIHTTGAIPLQPAVFFKKELYQKTGGFKTEYRIAGDYEFWLNVLQENPKLVYLDKTFGYYTIVNSGASQSFKGVVNGFRETHSIAKKYHQPFYGTAVMFVKYTKGFLGKFIR